MLETARDRARDLGEGGENMKRAENVISTVCSSILPILLFAEPELIRQTDPSLYQKVISSKVQKRH